MTQVAIKSAAEAASHVRNGDIQSVALHGRVVRSRDLLGDDDGVIIDHNGKLYELRSLPGGRLILTGWKQGHGGGVAGRFSIRRSSAKAGTNCPPKAAKP